MLEQVRVDNEATFKRTTMEVRDLLFKVKVNGQKIFNAVEQGSEQNNNNLLVVMEPRKQIEAR